MRLAILNDRPRGCESRGGHVSRVATALPLRRQWTGVVLLGLACLQLGACGGGGSRSKPAPEPTLACGLNERPQSGSCASFGVLENLRVPTPFIEHEQPVRLEVVLVKPQGPGPFPALMIHHGSTGDGSDPSAFKLTFTSGPITEFFVTRGWLVAFPQRRGRSQSDGVYDEGFKADRSGYSCEQTVALAGADHALEDLDVLTDWFRSRADVDIQRMVVSGTSRGGILATAHSASQQDVYAGVINFVGGWLGENCGDYLAVNRTLFVTGSTFPRPTLWLYGANDSFYSLDHSQSNFEAFVDAGGLGTFEVLRRAGGANGHFVINDPELWGDAVTEYLANL